MNKTHKERVIEYLKEYGEITSMDAIEKFGYTRLSDCIYKLKKEGYNIESVNKKVKNRYGASTHITVYKLVENE